MGCNYWPCHKHARGEANVRRPLQLEFIRSRKANCIISRSHINIKLSPSYHIPVLNCNKKNECGSVMFTLPLLASNSCCWHRGSTPGRPSVARNNLQRLVTFTLANFQSLHLPPIIYWPLQGSSSLSTSIIWESRLACIYSYIYVQYTERFRAHALGWHWPAPSESKLSAQQPASQHLVVGSNNNSHHPQQQTTDPDQTQSSQMEKKKVRLCWYLLLLMLCCYVWTKLNPPHLLKRYLPVSPVSALQPVDGSSDKQSNNGIHTPAVLFQTQWQSVSGAWWDVRGNWS